MIRHLCRGAVWALILSAATAATPLGAQDTTVEQLKELQELRKEVDRKKAELRRELRLLKEVLGEEPSEELMQLAGGTEGGMTPDELAAELRILREEIERLRQSLARERLTAEDARFDVVGSVRTRFEWSDEDFTSGGGDVRQLLRTRVLITGRPRHDTRVVVELQDGRLWGEEAGPGGDGTLDASGDQVDFHQAYVELREIYGKPLRLRLGRQELVYGSRRLMGPGNWGNPGRAHDGLALRLGDEDWVDLFTTKLAETGVLDPKGVRDRNLFGLWGEARLADGHRVGPYVLLEQDKNAGALRLLRATGGSRFLGSVTGQTGHLFGYDLEGAVQVGEAGDDDVLAFMATGTLRYRGPSWTEPEVRFGVDFLSGDSDPADTDREAFDNLFATRHDFYGLMDLFRRFPDDTGAGGLIDFKLGGEMSAAEAVRVGLHLHHFALVEETAAGSGKNLGQEADAVVTYEYNEVTTFHWGGSILVPGDAMKVARGGEDPAFRTWMQLVSRF